MMTLTEKHDFTLANGWVEVMQGYYAKKEWIGKIDYYIAAVDLKQAYKEAVQMNVQAQLPSYKELYGK